MQIREDASLMFCHINDLDLEIEMNLYDGIFLASWISLGGEGPRLIEEKGEPCVLVPCGNIEIIKTYGRVGVLTVTIKLVWDHGWKFRKISPKFRISATRKSPNLSVHAVKASKMCNCRRWDSNPPKPKNK